MTDQFPTMMKWFSKEADVVEYECQICGKTATRMKSQNSTKYCPNCRHERDLETGHEAYMRHQGLTGDPEIDLTRGVILQAIRDARRGNREAKQFLNDPYGAEAWLRVNGIGVTNSMRMILRRVNEPGV